MRTKRATVRDLAATGTLARVYAAMVVALRYPLLIGWIAVVAAAVHFLPGLQPSDGSVGNIVPPGAPALRAEADATRIFGEPLGAPVAVVQRDARGLSEQVQRASITQAVDLDLGRSTARPIAGLAGALPVPNAAGVVPGSREQSTTVITFLYFRPDTSVAAQTAGAQQYARGAVRSHLVGVTGAIPATFAQGLVISQRLPWVELATVLMIALVVGFYFRSVGAPLATLSCAVTAYLLAIRVDGLMARHMHAALPPDVEPVLVVLLLGITTDYTVFFMSGMRRNLAAGLPRITAARLTTAEFAPIILAAGLIVAAGTASLAAAKLQLISAFGPGLALTVVTAMVVSLTLGPALIAIFGGLLFRPGPLGRRRRSGVPTTAARQPEAERAAPPGMPVRERIARIGASWPVALLLAAACVAVLLGTGWTATQLQVGSPLIAELPASAAAARANDAASAGFAPGILAPTEILVLGHGVSGQSAALARLQAELSRQPGVAGVIGPATLPTAAEAYNPMLARSGNAARFGVIETTDPLGSAAVRRTTALEARLPALARAAGLRTARLETGGETAAVGDAITATKASLGRIALIMMAVTLLLLALFLRALIAPVYLLAASALALLATLGVTVLVFQRHLGYDGLVYYVPFTVAVLLVSLGADYNVFVVGRIWEEARRRSLPDAVAVAGTQASRAITVAAVALASSFALLAIIPLEQFREIAFAMSAGVLIDALIVRSVLVPALVALFGRAGMWPGRRPGSAPAGPVPARIRTAQPEPVSDQQA